jgi:hypothetical protein
VQFHKQGCPVLWPLVAGRLIDLLSALSRS